MKLFENYLIVRSAEIALKSYCIFVIWMQSLSFTNINLKYIFWHILKTSYQNTMNKRKNCSENYSLTKKNFIFLYSLFILLLKKKNYVSFIIWNPHFTTVTAIPALQCIYRMSSEDVKKKRTKKKRKWTRAIFYY